MRYFAIAADKNETAHRQAIITSHFSENMEEQEGVVLVEMHREFEGACCPNEPAAEQEGFRCSLSSCGRKKCSGM